MQDEGNAAFTYVHGPGSTANPVTPSSAQHAAAARDSSGATASQPAPRLSATHIATTAPGPAGQQQHASASSLRTPAPAELSQALLGQSATPYKAAQELAAQLAVSPSVLTPSVASAMAAAGAAAAQGLSFTPGGSSQAAGAGLDVIKAKLETLKEQISAKTKKMNAEKRAKIQGQIEKLEKSLKYVEQQRVSARAVLAGDS